MNLIQIVFSPTGGTQRVADYIAEEWGGCARRVDLTDAQCDFSAATISEADIAVIAMPSYGGRVPALAAERLAKIRGNGARCVLVCVYGNREYEDTLVEMQDIAEQCGFRVAAAVAAVAEHSIVRRYAAGRPDPEDAEVLRGFAKKIRAKLEAGEGTAAAVQIPGNRPYKKSGGAGMTPKAGSACIGCGLCAEQCPAGAISKDDLKNTDGKTCISCMRCVAKCPQAARHLNGAMVSAVTLALKKVCSERKSNALYI